VAKAASISVRNSSAARARPQSLVVTDSIEPSEAVKKTKNIRVVPVAPLFAQAIVNIANGTSVSSLFEAGTLEPIYEALYPNAAA
jgi:ribose-phosphate pyrophosphokinase